MQAVIFAAGEGMRMRPLTETMPKPLLTVGDICILEHNLVQLSGLVDEIILVIGYKGDMIKSKLGDSFKGMKIKYVEQNTQLGTGDAAKQALPFLEDSCLFINGDDLYHKEDITALLEKFPSIMASESENPEKFGVIMVKDDRVVGLVEKPKNPQSKLVNTGVYHFPSSILSTSIEKSSRGEYEFTDYVKQLLQDFHLSYSIAKKWFPIATPESLSEAEDFLLSIRQEV